MRSRRFVSMVAVAGLLIAGCSGDGDSSGTSADGSAPPNDGDSASFPAALLGEGPTVEDHWHMAYGVYACDRSTGELSFGAFRGNQEGLDENGQQVEPPNPRYVESGVHSHDDGVIHWHAFGAGATGVNATLGVFLDVYDVMLSDSELGLPAAQGGSTFSEGETMCGDEPGVLSVTVWPEYDNVEDSYTVTEGLNDIPITKDDSVFVISFAPEGTAIPQPEWAADLPRLGAVDGG